MGASELLIIFGWDVLCDVLDLAVEDAAEIVDRGGVQGFVFSQLVDGGAGNAVSVD